MKALRKMFMMNPLLALLGKLFFGDVEFIDQEIELREHGGVVVNDHVKQVFHIGISKIPITNALQNLLSRGVSLIAKRCDDRNSERNLRRAFANDDLLEIRDSVCHLLGFLGLRVYSNALGSAVSA